jgi:hypothetical protein
MTPRSASVNLLANYAAIARGNVEALARREAIAGSENLKGYCAIASRHLWMMAIHLKPVLCAGVFRQYDKDTNKYFPISGHVWLELDGYIVDITATQFAGTPSKVKRDFGKTVYVSPLPNPHYLKTHSGDKAFERIRNWHEAPLDDICATIPDHTRLLTTRRRKKSK